MSGQNGRFVWHDLMTTDLEKSREFYGELFGWKVHEVDMGPTGTYRMIRAGEEDIGGMVPLDAAQNVPSHWLAYAHVEDVDAACQRATGGGGQVLVPPTGIPGVGRFAVVQDPTGGCIAPFRSDRPYTEETEKIAGVGTFCWGELLTHDVDAARRFYGELFGWGVQEMAMPEGTYTVFTRGQRQAAGAMKMPPEAQAPSHWMHYIVVEGVDAAAARIQELGGKLWVEPRDIEGIGRFAVGADTTGGTFAVFKSA